MHILEQGDKKSVINIREGETVLNVTNVSRYSFMLFFYKLRVTALTLW